MDRIRIGIAGVGKLGTFHCNTLSQIAEAELVGLYAGCRAVVFAPVDEEYGYVTLEAFLSGKPVITATDSGGPLEFVEDGVTGRVVEPDVDEVAGAIAALAASPSLAAALGEAGCARARLVTWDGVIEQLIGEE